MEGWVVHHNYFRLNEDLGGRTPADVAGAEFPFKEWADVVEAADRDNEGDSGRGGRRG